MSLGIGGHHGRVGRTEVWLTPPYIIHALGPFDLDPCAAPTPRPWPTAKRHIELPDDGLSCEWEGRVWLNPPYGDKTVKWVRRLSEHGHGTALIFARTETELWTRWIWPVASAIKFVAGRLTFHHPDGTRAAGNGGAPSALVAYGADDARKLNESNIPGYCVMFPERMSKKEGIP